MTGVEEKRDSEEREEVPARSSKTNITPVMRRVDLASAESTISSELVSLLVNITVKYTRYSVIVNLPNSKICLYSSYNVLYRCEPKYTSHLPGGFYILSPCPGFEPKRLANLLSIVAPVRKIVLSPNTIRLIDYLSPSHPDPGGE
jgi:hypothetical protein